MYDFSDEVRDLARQPITHLSEKQAEILVTRLGGLSPWVFRREILEKALPRLLEFGGNADSLLETPAIQPGAGSCWILIALGDEGSWPAFYPGFVLPLRWVDASQNVFRRVGELPACLDKLAQDVVSVLKNQKLKGLEGSDWRLVLNVDGDPPGIYDLENMPITDASSAWAMLMASLLVTVCGGDLDPRVAASACWEDGLKSVGNLSAKGQAAARHGIKTIYVAGSQTESVLESVNLEKLNGFTQEPIQVLLPLLDRLKVPPTVNDHLSKRSKHYWYLKNTLKKADGAAEYYQNVMFTNIVSLCEGKLKQLSDRPESCDTLITIKSHNPELVSLSLALFEPKQVYILYTQETSRDLEKFEKKVETLLPDWKGKITNLLIPGSLSQTQDIWRESEQLKGVLESLDETCVIDVTAGPKAHTVALTKLAWRASRPVYILQSNQPNSELEHGSEQPLFLGPD